MDIYYLIFFVAFFLCFFDFVQFKKLRIFLYALICIFLIFFIGLRKIGIDNDSPMYSAMYVFYEKASLQDIWQGGYGYVEKGYVFLNKLIYLLGGDFRILLIIMALLTGIVNYLFFVKKTNYIFISLLAYLSFYFFYRDFTQIRYALCAAICFWCIHFFIEKKYYKSIFCLILAFLFHNSAIILLPVLPFLLYFKNRTFLVLLPIPCFIIGYLFNLFPLLLMYGYSNEHMDIYLQEDGGGGYAVSILGYFLVLVFLLLDKYSKKVKFTDEQYFYFRIVAFSISLNFLFAQSAIFQRFTFILFQCFIILISILIHTAKKYVERKENFFIIYLVLSVFLLYYGVRMVDPKLMRPYEISFSE